MKPNLKWFEKLKLKTNLTIESGPRLAQTLDGRDTVMIEYYCSTATLTTEDTRSVLWEKLTRDGTKERTNPRDESMRGSLVDVDLDV